MSFSNIIFAAICLVCSFAFGAISIWANGSKKPVHFWSGTTVNPDETTDIPAYNRANGLMWFIYAICMVVISILSLFDIRIGAVLLVIICVSGTIALVIAYRWIYKKYRNTVTTYKTKNETVKTHKSVMIAIISFVGIILL